MNNFGIWLLPGLLIAALGALGPSMGGFYCALAIQVGCFFAVVQMQRSRGNRSISCVGAFTFSYLLFFVARPLFLVLNDDKALFAFPLAVNVSFEHIYKSLLWAAAALVAFLAGASLVKARDLQAPGNPSGMDEKAGFSGKPAVSSSVITKLLLLQLISTVVLFLIGGRGRSTLTEQYTSAYIYFLPSVVQSIHIIAVMVILDRQRQQGLGQQFTFPFLASAALLLVYTYYMRNVSAFRGYYMTGLIAAFLSSLMCLRGRAGYLWIVIPMLFLLPIVSQLGAMRTLSNQQIRTYIDQNEVALFGLSKVWTTFSSSGDFNIFDTFIAANHSDPKSHPYILQWLYTLVHWVPRAFWESKPKGGLMIDTDFLNKAPFTPGVSGLFYLEGGYVWMLVCMIVLGIILARMDSYQFQMKDSFYKFCFYGIMVTNSIFAPRVVLYQSVYQTLYMLAPCWILTRWISRSQRGTGQQIPAVENLPVLLAPPRRPRQTFNPVRPGWQAPPG